MEVLEGESEEIEISRLPNTPGWTPSIPFYNYQGFWYPVRILKGIIIFRKNFIPQPTDIILSTPIKSGTTWLKALSFAILTRTKYTNNDSPLLFKSPQDLVPCAELFLSAGNIRVDPENPLVHTHVPFSSLPKSIVNSNLKIIYLCRDPKDVFVSLFFFFSTYFTHISLERVCEMFCSGTFNGGPYWDHVLGYWKASLEFPDRVLFLKYEDLKKDTCFYVKKIAYFMGCGFSIEEENNGCAGKIAQMCSFKYLSNLDVNKSTNKGGMKNFSNSSFFRKGETGDWKNYLTPQMAKKIDQITYQKFNAHGLNM